MYPKQLTAIFEPTDHRGNPARISCTEASTKSGKTVSGIGWIYEQAVLGGLPFHEYVREPRVTQGRGKHYWWVAPIYPQAEIAYDRLTKFLPPDTFHARQSPHPQVEIFNEAVIDFKSGERPDGLYGQDVWAAVGDEASRWRTAAWHALRSTLTFTRGPLRLIGNVKGRRNFFYDMARRAQAGADGMAYYKIIAADAVAAGILEAAEIEEARRDLPEHIFRELYLAEPSDDEGNPFGFNHIRACINPDGFSKKRPIAFGVDLAKSKDWTVITGIDMDGAVAVFERFQRPWSETIPRIRKIVGMTPALVDSTGVGDPIVEFLQKDLGRNFEGYNFGSASKQKLMEGLAVVIQNHETRYPGKELCPIASELEVFEYSYAKKARENLEIGQGWVGGYVKYAAAQGYHDDCVDSLALAHECRRQNSGLEVWRRLADQDRQHAAH